MVLIETFLIIEMEFSLFLYSSLLDFFFSLENKSKIFQEIIFLTFLAPIYIANEDAKQILLAYASSRILQPSRSKILILFYGFIYQFSSSHVFYFFAEIK